MLTHLLVAGLLMAGLGAGLSSVLAVADRKLRVQEDPRIDQIEGMLPRANCGGCGEAGCRAFAEAVATGRLLPGRCPVSSASTVKAIALLMGMESGTREKRVARLACRGGNNVAFKRARYEGLDTCRGAMLVAGGGKGCAWGCLGYGDCAVACPFYSIQINKNGLPVVIETTCTGCGNCVTACPRKLFSVHPISHQLWVACKNEALGEEASDECEVACTGCGRCALDAAAGVISIQKNLACVSYEKNNLATEAAIQRCPTGAIIWLDRKRGVVKGLAAKRVLRNTALPVG